MRLMLAVDIDIDHSAPERLIAQAVAWAEPLGATLDLAFVGTGSWALGSAADPEVKLLIEREAARAREAEQSRLQELLAHIPEAHRGEARVLQGPAVAALVEASKDHRALLVGTHSRSGFARFWLGSVSEQLVRRATCPVLVLRLPADD